MEMNKKGFTLAEVLITLGVIGIVAALTLPTLATKYQQKQTAIQLKKVYSLIEQAFQRAEADYEAVEYWDFTLNATDFKDRYIKPYFHVIKEYDTGTFPTNIHNTCIQGYNCDGYFGFKINPKIILTDGTMLSIERLPIATGAMINILVDLNGLKKPNRYGRDVFAFTIQQQKGVLPYGVGYFFGNNDDAAFDREKLMNEENNRNCNRNKDGVFCAAVIMIDGWEIKEDYPW